MAREQVDLDMTLHQLGQRLGEQADDAPRDEAFRDLDGRRMSDAAALALARRIEEETGEQIVFSPPPEDRSTG